MTTPFSFASGPVPAGPRSAVDMPIPGKPDGLAVEGTRKGHCNGR